MEADDEGNESQEEEDVFIPSQIEAEGRIELPPILLVFISGSGAHLFWPYIREGYWRRNSVLDARFVLTFLLLVSDIASYM